MIYGYACKCTESQRSEIVEFAVRNGIAIDQWTEDISLAREGDIVIACSVLQLGNDLLQVLDQLMLMLKAGTQVWMVEGGYKLGGTMLASAFGLCSELERRMFSHRLAARV